MVSRGYMVSYGKGPFRYLFFVKTNVFILNLNPPIMYMARDSMLN